MFRYDLEYLIWCDIATGQNNKNIFKRYGNYAMIQTQGANFPQYQKCSTSTTK